MTSTTCNHRSGGPACKGKVHPTPVKYRDPKGHLTTCIALVCNRCGQSHGLVDRGGVA